jgi:hypothetical protein
MSARPQTVFERTQDQAVLGELLHSLSQPLTTLRCSLELSVEDIAGRQQDAISAALAQTDRVIGVVRLMREYLDTESIIHSQPTVALGPVVQSVVDDLLPFAHEEQISLQLTGGCDSRVGLAEPRLRLALRYLITVVIEQQARCQGVTLRLEQRHSEAELRGMSDADSNVKSLKDPALATVHSVQLAIARRLLECAGASLIIGGEGGQRFLLRIPRPSRDVVLSVPRKL